MNNDGTVLKTFKTKYVEYTEKRQEEKYILFLLCHHNKLHHLQINPFRASNLLVKQRLELQGACQKVQERKKQFCPVCCQYCPLILKHTCLIEWRMSSYLWRIQKTSSIIFRMIILPYCKSGHSDSLFWERWQWS